MAGSKSPTWYKILLALSVYLTLFLVFVGESYLIRMVEAEDRMNRDFYSDHVAEQAKARGDAWFTKAFIDTGLMMHTFDMFIPTADEVRRSEEAGLDASFGQGIFAWWEGRLRAWWTLVWSTFTRISSVMLWLPYVALILVPFVVDGWAQRERRKHTFEFSSPVKQRYAIMAIATIPLVFIAVATAPIAMHPGVTPGVLFAIGLMLQTSIANFMKRA